MKSYKIFIIVSLFILSKVVTSQIPTSGLIGKYSFNGNANNEVGSNANGVVSGATLTTDRCGNINSAYHFVLPSDHIAISDFKFFTENEVSISLWAQADLLTSNCMLMLAPDNWNDRCVLCAQYVGSPSFVVWDYGNCATNGRTIVNGLTFSTEWHHYVYMTSQSQNLKKIYMDGNCISSLNFMGSLLNYLNRDLYIGGGTDWTGGGIGFKGSIDDIRIYERALTDTEVLSLFNEINCNVSIENDSDGNSSIIFPNPTSDKFDLIGFDSGIIQIYNMQAQIVKTHNINLEGNSVNISDIPSGIYTIKMLTNTSFVSKLVKY